MSSEDIRTHSRTGVGGEHIVAVTGQVDLATAEPFQRALDAAAAGRTRLTVDLTGLGFLDSAGIKVLFGLAARLDLILLVDLRSVIATTLDVSGLGEAATIRALD
jgi:anti-sigma B factor antagonist